MFQLEALELPLKILTLWLMSASLSLGWRDKPVHLASTFITDQGEIVYRWQSPPGSTAISVLDTCRNDFGDGSTDFEVVTDIANIARWKADHGSGNYELLC